MDISYLLKDLPPLSQNNSRSIYRKLIQHFLEKPNKGLENHLNDLSIGVDWTDNNDPDDFPKPEGLYWLDKKEVDIDEELEINPEEI